MKIVVSVMPRSLEEANQLELAKYEAADLIEWRADYLPKEEILRVAPAIFEKFQGREVIFTLRTTREGGHIELSDEEYVCLIREVASLYQPDFIDFEYFSYQSVFDQMLNFPNLILSYHNVTETPENLMAIFSELTALSPRIVKIAVMPASEQDVLDVMNYTRGFKSLNPEQDYVTMSLGRLGQLSRLAGRLTGSVWTFAAVDDYSAQGQLPLKPLKQILAILDDN